MTDNSSGKNSDKKRDRRSADAGERLTQVKEKLRDLRRQNTGQSPEAGREAETGRESSGGPDGTRRLSGALQRLRQRAHRDRGGDARAPRKKEKMPPETEKVVLEGHVGGRECAAPAAGTAYVIERPLAAEDGHIPQLSDDVRDALQGNGGLRIPEGSKLPALRDNPEPRIDNLLFLDLETTGLGGTPLFLIGIMTWSEAGMMVRQYFARDYDEEPATISLFAEDAQSRRLLVSYNGKSFDWPYLRTRAAVTRVPLDLEFSHLDLLHEARHRWSDSLPNCQLKTVEKQICGRDLRADDIPGSEIPAAYHDYVQTQDAADMMRVLEHNFLDLVTLADILLSLVTNA